MRHSGLFLYAALLGLAAYNRGAAVTAEPAVDAAAGTAVVPAASERVTEDGADVVVHQDQGDRISK